MGKAIERIAVERGHSIVGRVDVQSATSRFKRAPTWPLNSPNPSRRGAMSVDASKLVSPWFRERPVGCSTCPKHTNFAKRESAFFYASNYSLGVNIFFKLNEYLAKLMAKQTGYRVSIDETHHTQKKDAPSGTAITLAQGVIKNHPAKKQWVNHMSSDPADLVIRSFRVDPAPGTHTIQYQSAIDDITITHTAHSREGFAMGAVLVAEWIQGRQGSFSMDDFLTF